MLAFLCPMCGQVAAGNSSSEIGLIFRHSLNCAELSESSNSLTASRRDAFIRVRIIYLHDRNPAIEHDIPVDCIVYVDLSHLPCLRVDQVLLLCVNDLDCHHFDVPV